MLSDSKYLGFIWITALRLQYSKLLNQPEIPFPQNVLIILFSFAFVEMSEGPLSHLLFKCMEGSCQKFMRSDLVHKQLFGPESNWLIELVFPFLETFRLNRSDMHHADC